MTERFDFTFRLAEPKPALDPRKENGGAMRILILGDFSGKGTPGRGRQQASEKHPVVQVDIDNFDRVMTKIAPQLRIQLDQDAASAIDLTFYRMGDFHPDALSRKLESFQGLAGIRAHLNNPATFAGAAEQLRDLLQIEAEVPAPEGSKTTSEDDGTMLERLLGDRPAGFEQSAERRLKNAAASYIGSIVAHAIVPDAPPFQAVYLKAADEALSAKMRKLLHHPDFQALEAIWRALKMLVDNLETGEALSLHLLDITKEELCAELGVAGENLAASGLYRRLAAERVGTFGGEPWSLLVGNYRFGASPEDSALLAAMGAFASHAGGPFMAAADEGLLGCRSLAESSDPHGWKELPTEEKQRWHALRQTPAASWIGLALPRILLRLPYGPGTDPVDGFEFEEISSVDGHEAFLWGNPALFCALLLGRSSIERGDEMQPGDHLQIDDLPAYVLRQEGGSRLLPCAEVELNDKAMEKILDLGIMPFLSHRSRNSVRLARFQSLAYPATGLCGFWSA